MCLRLSVFGYSGMCVCRKAVGIRLKSKLGPLTIIMLLITMGIIINVYLVPTVC